MVKETDKDLDEDLELDEEEGLDEDSDESSDGEDKAKKKEKAKDDEEAGELELEVDGDEEDEETKAKRAEEDAHKEEIRARRRREKKLKRQRAQRERMTQANTIAALQQQIKELSQGQTNINGTINQFSDQHIDSQIAEATAIYNQQQAIMERAISETDGATFTKAKTLSDKAWAKYNQLALAKQQRQAAQQNAQQQTQQAQSGGIQLGDEAKRYGQNWAKQNEGWYDPSGNNLDSRIVQAIDADLYNEGYDPESQDYWEELTDRVKDRLPHHFKNRSATQTKKKPPQLVGGSGGSESTGAANIEKTLPKELIQTLKVAGMWDDKATRNKAIKDYMKNRKRSA